MSASVFISHSFADGADAAKKVDQSLSNIKDISIWSPKRSMRLGRAWPIQAGNMISKADVVLLIMTKGSFDINSACRMECITAQNLGVPVIPLRMAKIDIYPDYIYPRIIMVDFLNSFNEGLEQLKQEIEHIHSLGIHRDPMPEATWRLGGGEIFRGEQHLFYGEWLITRRPIPGEKFAFIPKYELFLRDTGRFRERVNSPITRFLKVEGMWSFHSDRSHLLLVQDAEHQRVMTVAEHLGPNRFGGMLDNRRYRAERLLEFR